MQLDRSYIYSFITALVFLVSFFSQEYDILIYLTTAVVFISLVDKIGKGVVLRELISLHSVILCLNMPLLGYNVYNDQNPLAKIWFKYMFIPEVTYFSFALPAVVGFVTILCWPVIGKFKNDHINLYQNILPKIRELLSQPSMKQLGIILVVVGLFFFGVSSYLPASLQFASLLFYFASFAGILYIYYSPSFRFKRGILLLFLLFIVGSAIGSGMFTTFIYMGVTIFSLIFLGRKVSFLKKIAIISIALYSLVLIQNVKPIYRQYTWYGSYKGNKSVLFLTLLGDAISKGALFSEEAFFPIYTRANQGFNVALVMRYIPSSKDHDHGSILIKNIGAAFVPRILWPDKPEAGGKFNMKNYANVTIKGWSTNIGPLGEAYGGFGVNGGIIYMLILSLLIRFAYFRFISLSNNYPLLLLWLPVLFFQITYSAETDTLQIFNSLLKSSFFVWILFKLNPVLFGKKIEMKRKERAINYVLPS